MRRHHLRQHPGTKKPRREAGLQPNRAVIGAVLGDVGGLQFYRVISVDRTLETLQGIPSRLLGGRWRVGGADDHERGQERGAGLLESTDGNAIRCHVPHRRRRLAHRNHIRDTSRDTSRDIRDEDENSR